jgi:hypothetical protein
MATTAAPEKGWLGVLFWTPDLSGKSSISIAELGAFRRLKQDT